MQRRNTIIELMRSDGLVSDADASLARAYPLALAGRSESGDVAPYFLEWIRQQLDARFGQRLYEQGLKIYTTLDLDLQSAAERALETQLRAIEAGKYGPYRHLTYEQYLAQASEGEAQTSPNSPYLQGAFVAMDPRTGAVLAMVGGRDFDDSKFNRATQALRQPGSTFKPIVYSTAIQAGVSPSYLVDDEPLAVPQVDGGFWSPQNFDLKFEGRMTLRRAFYQSRNVPAIRIGMQLGEQNVIDEARKFGITSPIPPYPSIHIGAADVYPLELISSLLHLRHAGHARRPHRHHARRERRRQGALAAGSAALHHPHAAAGLGDGGHDEGRSHQGIGGGFGWRVLPPAGGRQDRHHQRRRRRLVHRLHVRPRGRIVDRSRQAGRRSRRTRRAGCWPPRHGQPS